MAHDQQLADALRVLRGIASVNMQTRDDAYKLRELAEWRLEAKRVLADTTLGQSAEPEVER
jgi:hypothetical protein